MDLQLTLKNVFAEIDLWKLVTFLCDLPYNMANKAITKRVVAEHAIEREEPKR